MAAVGGQATLFGSAQPTEQKISSWPTRRVRRRQARFAERGRLEEALGRIMAQDKTIEHLKNQVEALRAQTQMSNMAVAAEVAMDSAHNIRQELMEALVLTAPVLSAGISGSKATASEAVRRNLAAHVFHVPAQSIANMTATELNAAQRGQRRDRREADPRRDDKIDAAAVKEGIPQRTWLEVACSVGDMSRPRRRLNAEHRTRQASRRRGGGHKRPSYRMQPAHRALGEKVQGTWRTAPKCRQKSAPLILGALSGGRFSSRRL